MARASKEVKIEVQNVEVTESDKIWSEVKDVQLDIFALPFQTVSMHASRMVVEPTRLYVTLKSSAVLPALELALGTKFDIVQAEKFIIISRK